MITLQELCSDIDTFLKINEFRDFGPNGLQVEGKSEVTQIATAVSASLATIEAAVDMGVDALIVHHGMFWDRDSYVVSGTKRKKLELLLQAGISLIAYHLPLDAHQEVGNNWLAAKQMGWTDLEPFGEVTGVYYGVKGKIPTVSRDAFQAKIEDYYQHPAHTALGGKKEVSSVALVSGGAYKMLKDAADAGVDCYMTGNFDEPAWHQAFEEKINFFALGHSATERIGPLGLCEWIQNKYGINCQFIDIENPF